MLHFLRKLRRKSPLPGGDKGVGSFTSRYLKYASGEILLVMIGILLALAINNWNNERLQKEQIKRHMHGVINDFDQIIQRITYRVIPANDYLIGNLEYGLKLLNDRPKHYKDSLPRYIGAIGTAWQSGLLAPNLTSFRRTGLISEIRSDSTKNILQSFETHMERIMIMDAYIHDQYAISLEPYLLKNFNYANIQSKLPRDSGQPYSLIKGGPAHNPKALDNPLELWNMFTIKLETQREEQLAIEGLLEDIQRFNTYLKREWQ